MRRERVGGRAPEGSGSGFRPGLEHLTDAHRQPPPAPEPSGEFKPRERGPGAIEKVGRRPGRAARSVGLWSEIAVGWSTGQAWAARALDGRPPPPPTHTPRWEGKMATPQMPMHPESEKQVREEWELGLSGSHCDEVVEDLD